MIAVWPWPLSRIARAVAHVGEYLVERQREIFWRMRANRLKDALLFALADMPHASDCGSDHLLAERDCDCWRSIAMDALDAPADLDVMTEMRDLRDEVEAWPRTLLDHTVWTIEPGADHCRVHCGCGLVARIVDRPWTEAAARWWVQHVQAEAKARGPF